MDILEYPQNNVDNNHVLSTVTSVITDYASPDVQHCINLLNRVLDEIIVEMPDRRCHGISAPQIGYSLRICILHNDGIRYSMINPNVESHGTTKKLFAVDCHSFGQYRAMIEYFDFIEVSFYDCQGNRQFVVAEKEFAKTIQHHIDHLQGILLPDRLKDKGTDALFVPREKQNQGKIPLKNFGVIMALRQKMGLVDVQSAVQYYSCLYNYDIDYHSYIAQAIEKRKEYVDIIRRYATYDMKLLEAGCGTSSVSIHLSKIGYDVTCLDIDVRMLDLARTMCDSVNGNVRYSIGDIRNLNYGDGEFGIVFSHGVLEHFSDCEKREILQEGLRIADTYIISVPTIWDASNNWLGDEIFWTVSKWKTFISECGFLLIEYAKSYPLHNILKRINTVLGIVPPTNAIFVVSKAN